jgi:hypothetical protein
MRLDMGAIGVGPDSTPSLPLLDTIFGRIFPNSWHPDADLGLGCNLTTDVDATFHFTCGGELKRGQWSDVMDRSF